MQGRLRLPLFFNKKLTIHLFTESSHLSRIYSRIFQGVFVIKNLILTLFILTNVAIASTKINGAGATFPYPIYSKWFSEYKKIKNDIEFNYQSIGSGGGIKQIIAQTVNFGATDAPMTEDELKQANNNIVHIPTVIGAVTVAYNLPSAPNGIKLSGDLIAQIFMGKITKWNDPKILSLNPQIQLPGQDILVVRRSDGSGTTAVFTSFLAEENAEFKNAVGSSKNVKWPVGIGAKGNEGVTAIISQTVGAIGYTELAYAKSNQLKVASIKNKLGEYTLPDVATMLKAATNLKPTSNDFRISITNSSNKGAYPLSALTWMLIYKDKNATNHEIKNFISWAYSNGGKMAEELHYSPIPKSLATEVIKSLK